MTRTITTKENGMFVSKWVRSSTIVALLTLGATACADSVTAPRGISAEDAGPSLAKGSGKRGNVRSRTFTIRPGHSVEEKFDEHTLTMPANAVCDPATSGYGVAFWDAPCTPARERIEVTAYWTEHNGHQVIRFQPDLRFVPSANPQRWVVLSVKHTKSIEAAHYFTILWRNPETGEWVDEALQDASQAADAKKNLRRVSRRLKHFSDYALWVGLGSYNVTSGLGGDIWGGW
jgi:hypothetical protein